MGSKTNGGRGQKNHLPPQDNCDQTRIVTISGSISEIPSAM
jgi:hypothetical protein